MKIDAKNFYLYFVEFFFGELFPHLCVMSCKSTCEKIPLLFCCEWPQGGMKNLFIVSFTLLGLLFDDDD
jgi:hypothetical protein